MGKLSTTHVSPTRTLYAALGSWWVLVGSLAGGASVFRLGQKFLDFGLSRVVRDALRAYADIFHFPIDMFKGAVAFIGWHIELSEAAKDYVILYLLVSGALVRCYRQLKRAPKTAMGWTEGDAGLTQLEAGIEYRGLAVLDLISNAFRAISLRLRGFRLHQHPVDQSIERFLLLATVAVLAPLLVLTVFAFGDDVYVRADDAPGEKFVAVSSRGVLMTQFIALVAAVVGISLLNSATM